MQIFVGFLLGIGRHMTGLSNGAFFNVFADYFFGVNTIIQLYGVPYSQLFSDPEMCDLE